MTRSVTSNGIAAKPQPHLRLRLSTEGGQRCVPVSKGCESNLKLDLLVSLSEDFENQASDSLWFLLIINASKRASVLFEHLERVRVSYGWLDLVLGVANQGETSWHLKIAEPELVTPLKGQLKLYQFHAHKFERAIELQGLIGFQTSCSFSYDVEKYLFNFIDLADARKWHILAYFQIHRQLLALVPQDHIRLQLFQDISDAEQIDIIVRVLSLLAATQASPTCRPANPINKLPQFKQVLRGGVKWFEDLGWGHLLAHLHDPLRQLVDERPRIFKEMLSRTSLLHSALLRTCWLARSDSTLRRPLIWALLPGLLLDEPCDVTHIDQAANLVVVQEVEHFNLHDAFAAAFRVRVNAVPIRQDDWETTGTPVCIVGCLRSVELVALDYLR